MKYAEYGDFIDAWAPKYGTQGCIWCAVLFLKAVILSSRQWIHVQISIYGSRARGEVGAGLPVNNNGLESGNHSLKKMTNAGGKRSMPIEWLMELKLALQVSRIIVYFKKTLSERRRPLPLSISHVNTQTYSERETHAPALTFLDSCTLTQHAKTKYGTALLMTREHFRFIIRINAY